MFGDMKPLAAFALSLTAGLTVLAPTGPAAASEHRAAAESSWSGTFRAAVKSLPVGSEVRDGYDRDLFNHWVDADGDGCDTRDEVLISEATAAPTIGSSCSLSGGAWFSYYDRVEATDPSGFDVDHMVPLAEAWDSGARLWDAETRERYANDLGERRALVAVTAASNRSKSDQDPAEWMPRYSGCRYAKEFVAVKIRWSLSVDTAEKQYLVAKAAACKKSRLSVTKAPVTVIDSDDPPADDPDQDAEGLRVTSITYDPAGSDTSANENAEVVVLTNPTQDTLALAGWAIEDAAGHRFEFAGGSLAPGATVTLHSGDGTTSGTDAYAGWGHVWNNTGDTFTLFSPSGATEQTGSYPGGGSGTATF